MKVTLQLATERDGAVLEQWVRAYHAFEGIAHPGEDLAAAIRPLLGESALGRVWLICADSQPVGYVAICFGYSIEFSGRDAFIDELFIIEEERGKGIGKAVLAQIKAEAALLGVKALHLECARNNRRAQRLYRSAGFVPRESFFLMSASLDEASAQPGAPASPAERRG